MRIALALLILNVASSLAFGQTALPKEPPPVGLGKAYPQPEAIPSAHEEKPLLGPFPSMDSPGDEPAMPQTLNELGPSEAPLLSECCRREFFTDLREFPRSFWSDTRSLFTLQNAAILGGAGGLAAIAASNWDDDVRQYTLDHSRRWGGLNNVLDVAGHPVTHLAATGALYATSRYMNDPEMGDFSKAMLNALLLTDATDIVLKYSFDTTRPNGNSHSFPSGHVASSFAAAAVIEEYHGLAAGLSAYTVAGLVGWQRIDSRNHDLSDVLFGAALGYAIGKTVGQNHRLEKINCTVMPYTDAEQGSTGLLLKKRY